uniref:Essential meiotic structure-specific endonuclease 1 n=1 Tax=Neogobius melanostomus TaxID=47308 RepID=A0A8C6TS65_9GOBI
MDSCTDSNSDLDEELPFVLTKPPQPPVKSSARCDAMTISSDSDDDAPYVPWSCASNRSRTMPAPQVGNDNPKYRGINLSQSPIGISPSSMVDSQQNGNGSQSPGATCRAPKRTAGEVQKSKEEALRRKQAREEKQREKGVQRMGKEEEKAQKKAMAEAAKALRPEECIKYMVAVVDPGKEGRGALLSSLQTLGCSCAIEKQPLPRSVSWRRRTPGGQSVDGDGEQEKDVVIQMTLEDFINLSHSRTECGRTLTSWIQELQGRHPQKDISLVVIGLEQYFRSNKAQSQKKMREAVVGVEQGGAKRKKKAGAEGALPELSRVEVEEAVVHLQLTTGVCVHFLSAWKDFTEHITMATKAVAEAPFKRERDNSGFSFYLDSKWAGGQKVDRTGKGLLQVWRRQIQQLNRVSADMASAVLATYPSPHLLTQAYHSCQTERDKMDLLSDIPIRRGEGVTSTVRRVGPELSKRLCVLMTATDPEQTFGS